ncbi:MAG: hypothetical protein JXR83_17620 [Deltaproteobacteria bacterium]|nr:hypothetical protein [Deltaproteobacteria bacterium]
MSVEIAFASVIAFAVALVQVSRRTILHSGNILGPAQLIAGCMCAALVPALAVYALHFHPAWALGVAADSSLVAAFAAHGFWLALAFAGALLVVGLASYLASSKLLLAGRRIAVLLPAAPVFLLVLAIPLRGAVGGRFTGDEPPPTIIPTAIVIIFLVATLIAVSRFDAANPPQR